MTLKDLRALADAIGVVGGLVNGAVLSLAAWLLPTVTTSGTFQNYIRIFAFVGGLLGFFFTLTGSGGKGRVVCLRLRKRFLWASLAPAAAALFMILLTEGALARHLPFLISWRDFFLDLPVLANLTVGLGSGLAVYLIIGAIVLSWPKVWDVKLT